MLTQWTRVIHSDNGTLTDYTLAAQNDDTIPVPLVSAEDSIYIGSNLPFNNFYLQVNTANTNAATLQVEVWDGENFVNAPDVLDETASGGVTLSRDGVVIFAPDIDEDWVQIVDTQDSDAPPELKAGGLRIYYMYWMRIRVSADMSAGTVLDRIAYRFANTEQLNGIDPDIAQYLSSWESGKTDWNEQLLIASDHVITDLKARGLILHPGQLLRMDQVSLAAAYKALSIIYTPLGPDLAFRRQSANDNYSMLIDLKRFSIDHNSDGQVNAGEIFGSPSGQLVR